MVVGQANFWADAYQKLNDNKVVSAFSETFSYSGGFLVASVALKVFDFSSGAPLFSFTSSWIMTQTVIKIENESLRPTLALIRHQVNILNHYFPNMRVVMLVFSVGIYRFFPNVGLVSGSFLGFFQGFIFEQELAQLARHAPPPPPPPKDDIR